MEESLRQRTFRALFRSFRFILKIVSAMREREREATVNYWFILSKKVSAENSPRAIDSLYTRYTCLRICNLSIRGQSGHADFASNRRFSKSAVRKWEKQLSYMWSERILEFIDRIFELHRNICNKNQNGDIGSCRSCDRRERSKKNDGVSFRQKRKGLSAIIMVSNVERQSGSRQARGERREW